ncbi:MAG: hypothetical protein ABI193_17340 [Minicystis sp.]
MPPSLRAQRVAAHATADPLLAAEEAANIHADKTVGKVSDDIWNDVGRPLTGSGPHLTSVDAESVDQKSPWP